MQTFLRVKYSCYEASAVSLHVGPSAAYSYWDANAAGARSYNSSHFDQLHWQHTLPDHRRVGLQAKDSSVGLLVYSVYNNGYIDAAYTANR